MQECFFRVAVSVITMEGTECGLVELGEVANQTQGQVSSIYTYMNEWDISIHKLYVLHTWPLWLTKSVNYLHPYKVPEPTTT